MSSTETNAKARKKTLWLPRIENLLRALIPPHDRSEYVFRFSHGEGASICDDIESSKGKATSAIMII